MGSKLIETQVIKIWLPGAVVPKARPRVTRNGTYLPRKYRDWRLLAEAEILSQVGERSMLPLSSPVAVKILLQGRNIGIVHNLVRSILDALVNSGVLKDDRTNCISCLAVDYDQRHKEIGAVVEVEPSTWFRKHSTKNDKPCPYCKSPGWDWDSGCYNYRLLPENLI